MGEIQAKLQRRFMMQDRQREVARISALYENPTADSAIETFQVDRFNAVWKYCITEVPFYRRWAQHHNLPPSIKTTAEIRRFPVLKKTDIVDNTDEIFQHGKIKQFYSTGGTTGTPARYPLGAGEALSNYARTYVGRGWWGIRPFDSYVHLWGHAHLFTGGFRGRVAKSKRRVADGLIRATRINAYDMSEGALANHFEMLRRRDPSYLVGYTSAVVKLAHFIEGSSLDTRNLRRLKAVIVTAETLFEPDVEVLERVFSRPVVTEYGSAETGTIAVSRGATWPLQVFWDSFYVAVDESSSAFITTLTNRLFPLINYGIGDEVDGLPDTLGNVHRLTAVRGRLQDVVSMSTMDGNKLQLSAILPVHILKNDRRVVSVQFRQLSDRKLKIFVQLNSSASMSELASFFSERIQMDHPDFDPSSVAIEQVQSPILTKAGKHALVLL